jgi:peptidoglycan/xylan/chitin deacetylase (PgdA/CDA1 family)
VARPAPARPGTPGEERGFFCRRAVVTVHAQRAWDESQVRIILSFDDGPHHEPLGAGTNYTENVLRTLDGNSVQDGIKAIFFVQTHVETRGESDAGQRLISRMASEGHLVGIHTGSTVDHVDHRRRAAAPPYDWNHDAVLDERDGANGLESDLLRAKARVKKLTGSEPLLVRPTYGVTNAEVRAVYRKLGLRMLLWHLDSRDALDHDRGTRVIESNIRGQLHELIREKRDPIIVLFHDINYLTQAHLDDYLIAIYEAAEAAGKHAVFPTTSEELHAWLDEILGINHTVSDKPYEISRSTPK